MKKTLIAAAVSLLVAGPAAAAVITVEFTNEAGETQVWTFDQESGKTTAPDGEVYDYTYDEEARKLCGALPDGELCATFSGEETEMKVGAKANYVSTDGNAGEATIIEIKE